MVQFEKKQGKKKEITLLPTLEQNSTGERTIKTASLKNGRDELNLAEFPLTVLTDRPPDGVKTLVFQDQVWDKRTASRIDRKLIVSGSDLYGLPTPLDMDVLLCLIQMTKEANDFEERQVYFCRGDLIKMLRLIDSGKNYARIDESLRRWVGVTLYYDQSWWDKENREWISTDGFHILENIALMDRKKSRRKREKGQTELPLSSFAWNEIFLSSCSSGYVKALDLDTYLGLNRAISKRIYRYIDKHFYKKEQLELDLDDFCFVHVGMSRNFDVGKLKEKLQPSLEELEALGFLKPMSREERYIKVGKGKWRIQLTRGKNVAASKAIEQEIQVLPILQELIDRGVTLGIAEELVASLPIEDIQAQIEAVVWLIGKKDKRVSRNPPGYLVKAIRENYPLPKGFKTRAQIVQETEAKRSALEKEIENNRKKAETARREAARKAHEQAAVEAHLATLTLDQRTQIEREAITASGTDGKFFRDVIIRGYVARQLGIKEASE